MPPSYTPAMTPQQQQQFQIAKYLNNSASMDRPLSYEEFLRARGAGSPQAMAPKATEPDYFDLAKSIGRETGITDSVLPSATSAIPGAGSVGGAVPGAPTFDILGGYNPAGGGTPWANGTSGAPWAPGAEAPGMFDLSGIGGAGNAILPAAGAYGMYDLYKNKRTGARGIGQGAASGAAMGSYFGPWGAGIGAVLGGGYGAMQHESIRDKATKNTNNLLSKNTDDPVYQAYVRGMREQYKSGAPDPSKPFHGGQYGSWDEYQKAGLDANDLTGVKANLDLGPSFTNLPFEQQLAVTQAIINAGGYKSRKGEVEASDLAKNQSILQNEIATGFKTPVSSMPAAPGMALPVPVQKLPQPLMIPRSKTSSPGIGLDGRRISY